MEESTIPHERLCSKCRQNERAYRQRWCTACKSAAQARRRALCFEPFVDGEATPAPALARQRPVEPVLAPPVEPVLAPDPPRQLCKYCSSCQWLAGGLTWVCQVCRVAGPAL